MARKKIGSSGEEILIASSNNVIIQEGGGGGGTSHAVFTPVLLGSGAQAIGGVDNTWALTLRSETGFTYAWNAQNATTLGLPTGWSATRSTDEQTLTIVSPSFTTSLVSESITVLATSTHTIDRTSATHRIPVTLSTFRTYYTGQFSADPGASVQNSLLTTNDARLTSGTSVSFEPDTDGTEEFGVINIHSSFGTPAFTANGFPLTLESYPLSGGYTTYIVPFRRDVTIIISS